MPVQIPCLSCKRATPTGAEAESHACHGCGTALPPPSQAAWFMLRDGAQYGPYTIAELADWAAEGRLLPKDDIWYEGAAVRLEVNQMPQFGPVATAGPVPASEAEPEPADAAHPGPIVRTPCLACRTTTPAPEDAAAMTCLGCGAALPPPAEAAWFMLRDGAQFGPYTTGQLATYLAEGRILKQDSVWHEGAAVRLEAGQLPPFG